jgi:hypothetical protein
MASEDDGLSTACHYDQCDECMVCWCLCTCHEDDTTEEYYDR